MFFCKIFPLPYRPGNKSQNFAILNQEASEAVLNFANEDAREIRVPSPVSMITATSPGIVFRTSLHSSHEERLLYLLLHSVFSDRDILPSLLQELFKVKVIHSKRH